MEITGIIQSGAGKAVLFTKLDWVVEQFEKALGFKPFPGTLNVRVCDRDFTKMEAFFSKKDGQLVPDNTEFCSAWLKKVWINGIPGAVVFPSEDVRIHEKVVIEIMANCHLKETFHWVDGDEVTITDREI